MLLFEKHFQRKLEEDYINSDTKIQLMTYSSLRIMEYHIVFVVAL